MNGFAVGVSISCRGQRLTQSPIPLQVLGPSIEPYAETGNVLAGASNAIEFSAGAVKLERPIYLQPGERLDITLTHRNLIPATIQTAVTVSGRLVNPEDVPKAKHLPYWASWTPPAFTNLAAAASVTSSEKDLVNASPTPLEMSRIVGKLARVFTTSSGQVNFATVTDTVCMDWYDSLITVDLRSYDGTRITASDTTPFGAAFPAPRRSLEVPHVIRPGAFYRAKLALTAAQATIASIIQPALALHGYRRIA